MWLEVWGFEPGGLISPTSKEGRMLEMLSIPTMWLNCNKNLSELLWLAILCFLSDWCARKAMGPLGWWQWVSSNKPVQKLRSLSSPKKQHFKKETEQTNKRTMPLTSKWVISDSLLSSSSGLPSQVRSVLGSDPWVLRIGCLILRKTHRAPCNTAPHRERISTGTKQNPLRPLTQQGFWNTDSNEAFFVLFFSSELAALPVKTTRSRLTLPFKP